MSGNYFLELVSRQKLARVEELRQCNDFTCRFGLFLSESQIQSLVEQVFTALQETGRIEFGQGILKRLVYEFAPSPYIMQANYEDTLLELLDIFYYFKNDSLDMLSDDELIILMAKYFNACQGSLDYLRETALSELCRSVRFGL